MTGNQIQILITMSVYLIGIVMIGVFYAKRANKNSDYYFLGDRGLGPWVTAMSAEASDMSGWLLMGLPGVAYWMGIADAAWTAIGLALGTYINWLIVSKRLRRYSVKVKSITIPEFFSNRFHEKSGVILAVSALFILVFFTVYAASCLVTCGKLFSTLFGTPYVVMMIVGAVFVLVYTFLGGFLAESVSDFIQAFVMITVLIITLAVGVFAAGGFGQIIENCRNIPGFLEFFSIATPTVSDAGTQIIENGSPVFGEAAKYSALSVFSALAWGLGYFGMPQVLLRFMAISEENKLKVSRRIAVIWCVISLAVSVFIGIIGRTLYPTELLTQAQSENIFILMSERLLPPLIAGLSMAGILAATMSSSDSYLLIAASAFSKNIYEGILKKGKADDKKVMNVSRIVLLLIALIGLVIAWDEDSVIFTLVSFAWAGFGATFGPVMLFSLFWKRINRQGAIAGMLAGGISVFVWKNLLSPMGGVWGIYELFPAFVISCIFIVVVSLCTKEPDKEIIKEFEMAAGKTK